MPETVFTLPRGSTWNATVERLSSFLMQLDHTKAWKVTVGEHTGQRSDQQNKYLWGVCYKTLADAMGFETEEVHEFLCGTHFGWRDKKVPKKPSNLTGIESVPIRTTTIDQEGRRNVLSKQHFSDYVAFIQRFAAHRGVFIPDPET